MVEQKRNVVGGAQRDVERRKQPVYPDWRIEQQLTVAEIDISIEMPVQVIELFQLREEVEVFYSVVVSCEDKPREPAVPGSDQDQSANQPRSRYHWLALEVPGSYPIPAKAEQSNQNADQCK